MPRGDNEHLMRGSIRAEEGFGEGSETSCEPRS